MRKEALGIDSTIDEKKQNCRGLLNLNFLYAHKGNHKVEDELKSFKIQIQKAYFDISFYENN